MEERPSKNGSFVSVVSVLIWTVVLFIFWFVLSEKTDVFHLGVGAACSFLVAWFTSGLLSLPPRDSSSPSALFLPIVWFRFLFYLPWLFLRIFISALHVTKLVLHPQMPIHPQIVRFSCKLPHTLARLTLAQSITLTPGTATLDVEEDEFVVHCLHSESAGELDPQREGSVSQRVCRLFQ